jgi:hypothetical protein
MNKKQVSDLVEAAADNAEALDLIAAGFLEGFKFMREQGEDVDPEEVLFYLRESGSPLADHLDIQFFCEYCKAWLFDEGTVHGQNYHNDLDEPDEVRSETTRLVRKSPEGWTASGFSS